MAPHAVAALGPRRTMVRLVRANFLASLWCRGFGGRLALLGGILVACAIGALIGWNAVRLAKGQVSLSELACVDPTDPCNWSTYRVENDMAEPVVLRECLHHCGSGDRRLDPVFVGIGRTSRDVLTASIGSRAWWEVRSTSHRLLGCLVLDGHQHKQDGAVVVVSSAEPCSADAASTPTRPVRASD